MSMLQNEVALVTGASRGIGRAVALALGQQGATIVGTATSDQGATAITEALATAGIQGCGMALDVTQADAIDAIIADVTKRFGAPTILVNNAGIARDNLLMRMKDEEWQSILDTNLTSVYRTSKAVIRGMMKARRGRIINIGSVVGLTGNPGQANYAAAKAGLLGFSKSLAREIGSRNITVNVVAPGFIDTDMTKDLPDDIKEVMLKQIALGRLGSVDDVAAAVVFLASPAAAYITGETLNVNGGLYMP
jgi:3-oxoacyl-[acyl-carrier protein] reductase